MSFKKIQTIKKVAEAIKSSMFFSIYSSFILFLLKLTNNLKEKAKYPIFFGIKAFVLAGVVIGHDSSLAEAVGIWFLFTKLPTTILVMVFTIIVPCVQLYKKYKVIHIKAIVQMLLKQPCLLLAPHITPFAFTLNTENEKIIDDVPGTLKNGETVKFLSVSNRKLQSGASEGTGAAEWQKY